jgi:hypothetical protein
MSEELQVYSPRDIVDGWTSMLAPTVELTRHIAGSDFVPEQLRGNGPAVAAAILAGRELGLGPMASLQHIRIIKGTPALSANMQRGLVQAAGHHIRYVRTTSAECTVQGRRRGEDDWTTVTWTLDDARTQNLLGKDNWKRMPRQMLAARATAELCRLLFADVIAGMPYTVEDLDDSGTGVAVPAAPDGSTPTTPIRRRTPVASSGKQHPAPDTTPPSPPPSPPTASAEQAPAPADPSTNPPAQPTQPAATRAQLTRIHATLGTLGIADRDAKLHVCSRLVAQPLDSSRDLTRADASHIIDTLAALSTQDDPAGALMQLLVELEPAAEDAVDAEILEGTR